MTDKQMVKRFEKVAKILKEYGVMYAEVEVEKSDSFLCYYPDDGRWGGITVGDYTVENCWVKDDYYRFVSFENKEHKEMVDYLSDECENEE